MPAAAVIPAPIAYTKVVAVKKLVVGFRAGCVGPPLVCTAAPRLSVEDGLLGLTVWDSGSTWLL